MREPYVPLFCSIINSTLWLRENSDTRVVFFTLLALMDPEGYVASSLPAIARDACVSEEATRFAIERLSAPDPDSRSEEYDGRRIMKVRRGWRVLNAEAFRDLARREAEKARKRAWWHRNRGKDTRRELDELDESLDAPKPKPKPISNDPTDHSSSGPTDIGSDGDGATCNLFPSESKRQSDDERVFEHWHKVIWEKRSKRKAKLSPERRRRIRARLKRYSVDDLIGVLDRAALSEFHMGKNPTGQFYGDIDNLLGSDTKVDKWLAAAEPERKTDSKPSAQIFEADS